MDKDKEPAAAEFPLLMDLAHEVPLALDLDGTILVNDSLLESLLTLARKQPMLLLRLALLLGRGRAWLKRELANHAALDVATLPMRPEVLRLMQEQRCRGRRLLLVTGADRLIASEVARRLPLFDEVISSDGRINLCGAAKRDRLIARFGARGFDYVGNSRADLPVWASARQGWVVSNSNSLAAAVAQISVKMIHLRPRRPALAVWMKAIRVQQWPKNLLILAPLLLAQQSHEGALVSLSLLAMLCFSLMASSIYLLNDLLDLEADRHHQKKRLRPLASGSLPIVLALWMVPLLSLSAVNLSRALPSGFLSLLVGYFMLMLSYCLRLKDIPIIDALTLAAGYTLRIQAGAVALQIAAAPILLLSCGALFFGLALLKRYAELLSQKAEPGCAGRFLAYRPEHALAIAEIGIAASCLGVALLAGFTCAAFTLPPGPLHWASWVFCVLLMLWLGHMWLMAHRGRIREEPVAFAWRDGFSRAVAALMLLLLSALAWAGHS